jgi:hypothetical protein
MSRTRSHEKPNPLRLCHCGNLLETIEVKPQDDGSIKRTKKCDKGHTLVTFERAGSPEQAEQPETPRSFAASKRT